MLYMSCPTCSKLLGHIQIPYLAGVEEIDYNTSLSEEEKNIKKQDLLNKFIPKDRICCRIRLMGLLNSIKIII